MRSQLSLVPCPRCIKHYIFHWTREGSQSSSMKYSYLTHWPRRWYLMWEEILYTDTLHGRGSQFKFSCVHWNLWLLLTLEHGPSELWSLNWSWSISWFIKIEHLETSEYFLLAIFLSYGQLWVNSKRAASSTLC